MTRYEPTALNNRFRSSSSVTLKRRGQSSDSHRSLTMPSSARPTPSTAQMSRLVAVNWWKLRPHLRHLHASVEPRAADQPSILTAKSWVSQFRAAAKYFRPRPAQVPIQVHARIAPPDFGPCHFLAMDQLRSLSVVR